MEVRVKPDVMAELQVPPPPRVIERVLQSVACKDESSTEKFKIVFNGISSAASSGLSLTEIRAQLPTTVQVI